MKSSLYTAYITELIYFPLKITQNITIKSYTVLQEIIINPESIKLIFIMKNMENIPIQLTVGKLKVSSDHICQ